MGERGVGEGGGDGGSGGDGEGWGGAERRSERRRTMEDWRDGRVESETKRRSRCHLAAVKCWPMIIHAFIRSIFSLDVLIDINTNKIIDKERAPSGMARLHKNKIKKTL